MLHVHLTVKFRAFGITFANIRKEWREDLHAPLTPREIIRFSERGVTLVVGVS